MPTGAGRPSRKKLMSAMNRVGVWRTIVALFAVLAHASAVVEIPVQAEDETDSSEPGLTGLTVSPGALTPDFSADTYSYEVWRHTGDEEYVDITPTVRDGFSTSCEPSSSCQLRDNGDYRAALSVGNNTVTLKVTDDSAETSREYTISIVRWPEPGLAGLTFSPGTLTPDFSPDTYNGANPDTYNYTVSDITHDDTVSTVTLTVKSGYSTDCVVSYCISVDNDDDGNDVYERWLLVGDNAVTFWVTHDATKWISDEYTITVTRPGPIEIAGLAETRYLEEYEQAIGSYTGPPAPIGESSHWLRWSLSGEDSGDFKLRDSRGSRIWPGTGISRNDEAMLWFAQTPDYEDPADADGDNVYKVTIEVINANFISGSLDVTVTVEDLNEAGGL